MDNLLTAQYLLKETIDAKNRLAEKEWEELLSKLLSAAQNGHDFLLSDHLYNINVKRLEKFGYKVTDNSDGGYSNGIVIDWSEA